MKYLANVRKRVEKNIVTRIRRSLKGKGKINVKVGVEVTPSDIIGTSFVESGFRILNLSDLLSVSPNQIKNYLKKQLGQRVYKDELLAYKTGGLFGGRKIVTSPTDGTLDFLNSQTGEIRLTFLPKKVDLPSGVYGIVENINSDHGHIILKTQASRIYGVFGSGRLRDGNLLIIGRRENLLSGRDISPKFEGHIMVGGSLIFRDGIAEAISCNISGIITGGINVQDYKGMAGGHLIFPKKLENDIGVSIVVTEGFGSIPIGWDIYQLLSNFDGKFVSLDGNKAVITLPSFESKSMLKVRNTSLPPLLEHAQSFDEHSYQTTMGEVKVGVFVRVVGNTFLGNIGKVVAIDSAETALPSKVKTTLVVLETKSRKIKVPVANLEIISGA